MARLQRSIAAREDRIQKLAPDYDHAEIRKLSAELGGLRQKLATLTTQEVTPDV